MTLLKRMCGHLERKGKKILIAIDEVDNSKEMKTFVEAYASLVGQRYRLRLLMTGLYRNIASLQNNKSLTFLYRAPKIALGPLSIAGIAANYVELLKISREEATKLAKATKGYAYAYQVLGSLLYESREKVPSPKTWGLFDQIVADYVYDKVFSELSQQTKEFLMAMGSAQPVKIEDVAAKMGKTTKQISPYRDRLIKEGIIESPSHGYVSFALPRFDFFLTTK